MTRTRFIASLACTLLLGCSSLTRFTSNGTRVSDARGVYTSYVYVGGGNGTITRFAVDETSGSLSHQTSFDAGPNSTFLAVSADAKFLFTVNETTPGEVSSFAVSPGTGNLTFLSRTPSGGAGPAHLSVDHTGRWLFVANYGGGTASVIPIGADGRLGAATDVQASGGRAHYITASPDNRFVFVVCLQPNFIAQYRFDQWTGKLTPNYPATVGIPGANPGPRHLAFQPDRKRAYVINELNSTLTPLAYDYLTGLLSATPDAVSTLPEPVEGNTDAEVQVHPNGRYVYASNRGHNSIAAFAIDPTSGRLSPIGTTPTGGQIPRHFSLNETGTLLLVANQRTGNIVAMRVKGDGTLTSLGEVATGLGAPEFVQIVRVPAR